MAGVARISIVSMIILMLIGSNASLFTQSFSTHEALAQTSNSANSGFALYTNNKNYFTIQYTQGWRVDETLSNSDPNGIVSFSDAQFSNTISIYKFHVDLTQTSLKKFVDADFVSVQKYASPQVIDEESSTINNRDAYFIEYGPLFGGTAIYDKTFYVAADATTVYKIDCYIQDMAPNNVQFNQCNDIVSTFALSGNQPTSTDYTNYSLQQGEWVKYKMYLNVTSTDSYAQQRLQTAFTKLFSSFAGQQLNSLNDIDWLKNTITSVSTNNILIDGQVQVLRKLTDLGTSSLSQSRAFAIPTNSKIGDVFDTPISTPTNPSKATLTSIKNETVLGTNIPVYELTSSNTFTSYMTAQESQTLHYDAKTGILLDWGIGLKFYNSTTSAYVNFGLVPVGWSINPSSIAQPSNSTNPSLFDAKDSGCKDQYGPNFYYDLSLDKCMPPTGTWDYPGTDYLSQQCQQQYGPSYMFNGTQNRCLPSSGSPTIDDINQQCQSQFWPGFYYNSTQNACLPTGGSWQTYTPPQTGVTDSQGQLIFQVAGKSIPFTFVDGDTGSPLSGLDVSFALDSKSQTVGALLVLDPTNQYPFQVFSLIDTPPTTSPTSWKNFVLPNAYADNSQANENFVVKVFKDPGVILNLTGLGLAAYTGNPIYADLFDKLSKFLDGYTLAAKAFVGYFGHNIAPNLKTHTATLDEVICDIVKDMAAGHVRDIILDSISNHITHEGLSNWGQYVTGANGALDLGIVFNCASAGGTIKWYEVGLAGLTTKLYFCDKAVTKSTTQINMQQELHDCAEKSQQNIQTIQEREQKLLQEKIDTVQQEIQKQSDHPNPDLETILQNQLTELQGQQQIEQQTELQQDQQVEQTEQQQQEQQLQQQQQQQQQQEQQQQQQQQQQKKQYEVQGQQKGQGQYGGYNTPDEYCKGTYGSDYYYDSSRNVCAPTPTNPSSGGSQPGGSALGIDLTGQWSGTAQGTINISSAQLSCGFSATISLDLTQDGKLLRGPVSVGNISLSGDGCDQVPANGLGGDLYASIFGSGFSGDITGSGARLSVNGQFTADLMRGTFSGSGQGADISGDFTANRSG